MYLYNFLSGYFCCSIDICIIVIIIVNDWMYYFTDVRVKVRTDDGQKLLSVQTFIGFANYVEIDLYEKSRTFHSSGGKF